jgi:hypothetical protein
MYVRISLVMIVMGLTLAACQMGDVDPAGSRDNLAGGSVPGEAGGETGGEGATAPAEPVAPAPETVTTACDASVWTGDYAVRSQADLAALAGYTEVTGTLLFASDDIVHLSGLDCLTRVGGHLRFVDNRVLESVTAFENLYSVGGRIVFVDNRYLGAIGGFGELRSAGGLAFEDNGRLLWNHVFVVDGFAKLREVGGDVIFSNDDFQVLGFDELELITGKLIGSQGNGPEGYVDITILGMRELSATGGLLFEGTGRVVLDGLVDLEYVEGNVKFVTSGPVFTAGLSDLSRIDGDLVLDEVFGGEPSIIDLPDLEHIDGVFMVKDSGEIELGSFPELESIGGSLVIHESAVRSIVGFDELEVIEGDFRVVVAPLERLEGFDDLASIGGEFFLELGVFMTDLAAFDDLESIGGNFGLIENYALASISGFDDLESVGGNLTIRDNTALPTCEAEELLDRLRAGGFAGSASIEGNGPCE